MTEEKKIRKTYEKPRIAIEDFVLNQFIAGSCSIKTNDDGWEAELAEKDPFTYAGYIAGQFAEAIQCAFDADDDNDGICYHTQGSPLFT